MEKKMTYVVAIDKALEVVTDEEVRARLNDLKVAVSKRTEHKVSKEKQAKNEAVKAEILNVLSCGDALRVSEILAKGDFAEDVNAQKITAMLTALEKSGEVVKTITKKVSFFSLVESE